MKVFTSHFIICSSWIIFIKRSVRSRSVQTGREKLGFHHDINHCGILLSQWINCGAAAFPQPRTSIASRFQCGSKIKVQIQLLFCVADLWAFCLIYVTLIEVSKEIAAGSCTKGSHHVFQKLYWEAAIKTKWGSHLRIMRESCLAKSSLEHPLFTLLLSNQGAVMRDWYLNTGSLVEQKNYTKERSDPWRHQKAFFVLMTVVANLTGKSRP